MQEGDFVVGINSDDVKWSPHDQVVTMIKVYSSHKVMNFTLLKYFQILVCHNKK